MASDDDTTNDEAHAEEWYDDSDLSPCDRVLIEQARSIGLDEAHVRLVGETLKEARHLADESQRNVDALESSLQQRRRDVAAAEAGRATAQQIRRLRYHSN